MVEVGAAVRGKVSCTEPSRVYLTSDSGPLVTLTPEPPWTDPALNPYRALARLEPGTVLRGKVGSAAVMNSPSAYRAARGYLPRRLLAEPLRRGDAADVVIASLKVDEGRLHLAPAGVVSAAPN